MKKLSTLLILLLLLSLYAAGQAEAAEFEFDASAGKITAYNGAGGDVAVPAEIDGARVWDIAGNVFYEKEGVTGIALPEGMDVLNDNLTSQIAGLTHVELPQSLRVICRGNFQLCPVLTEVTVPPAVGYISDNCFCWCENLTSITFTGVCPLIGDYSFSNLAGGCVVRVPDDQLDAYRAALPEQIDVQPSGRNAEIVDIPTPESEFAFDPATGTITGYRDRLARMDIPAEIGGVAVKAIGENAFRPAYHLLHLTVPEGVEVIGDSAFAYTNSILCVELPDSVREIGNEAFLGAIRGNRFHWPASLETIGDKAFYNCYFTDDIEFGPALTSVGANAFENAWPKNLHICEGGRPWIGPNAFSRAGVDYIQMDSYDFYEMAPDAFAGSRVDTVDLPWDSGWDNRLAWQDYFDAQLEDCTVYINNPPDCEYTKGGDHYTKGEDGYFYLTEYDGDQEAPYLYYNIWDNSGEESVLVECHGVGDGVFKGSQTIRRYRVTHANWPWTIGDEAFAESSVELVDLFHTTERIGAGAFRDCKNLTEITLPASLKEIGAGAFDGCDNLAKVTVQCDLSVLPEDAFAGCAALMAHPEGLTLPASATDAQVAAMSEQLGLPWYAPLLREGEVRAELIPMPFEPTDAAEFDFDPETGAITRYRGDSADVVVPREIGGVPVRCIAQGAFEGCRDYTDTEVYTNRTEWTTLRSVVLPETVTAIDDSAFSYCQQLETFVCYGPVESTGRGTFRLARSLRLVAFVNGAGMIDNYCFENTPALETVYVPTPLSYIGESAFINSGIPAFVADARKYGGAPFRGCRNLTELHLAGDVGQSDGVIVYDCPNLSLLCLEGGDLSGFSRDGFVSGCAPRLTVRIPEDAGEALENQAAHCAFWGTNTEIAVERAACPRGEAALPDVAAILADYAANPVATPEPVITPEPVAAQPVGEAGAPYLGVWKVTEVIIGGEAHAASEFGMDMGFTLNEDGTAIMANADGSTAEMTWTVSDGAAVLDGVSMTLTEDGRLYADAEGMQMYLAREGEAPADVGIDSPAPAIEEPEPEPVPEPAPEPVPEPVPEPAADTTAYLDVTLTCVQAEAYGYGVDPAGLGGDYSVTFHGDGTVSLVIAGATLPNLGWTRDGDGALVVDCYGKGELRFYAVEGGYEAYYMNAMKLVFVG